MASIKEGRKNELTANFLEFCSRGDVKSATEALRNGADVKAKTDAGITALHLAVVSGNKDLVVILLNNYGLNVRAKDKNGWTSLHFAASNGNADIAKFLIKKGGIDVNSKTNDGYTALHLASKNNHVALATVLLDNGADANIRDPQGYTPLFYAAYYGYADFARVLLMNGAEVDWTYRDATYSDGVTVLHVAKMQKHAEAEKVILSFGGTDSHPITSFFSSIFS